MGRTGMACCPFHSDKSPSMKLDERYYCFGCGATGDAVDLTAKLFGIGLREAAVKLAEDFGLNYDSRQKPSVRPRIREPTPEQKYQKGENHCYKVLTDYFHLLREWEKKYAPKQPDEEWNPLFAEALHKKNYIEYLLDILLYGSLEERKALVAEQRKEVLKLEQRIAEYHKAWAEAERQKDAAVQETDEYKALEKALAAERLKVTEITKLYQSESEKRNQVRNEYIELRGIHDTLTSAYSAVKSDLEAAQAELQILKQEVIKSSKNPFGAGRKPKLTVEQVEQVKMLSAEGLSVRKIAAKMDCSAALICKLLKDDHK